tara:strand:- start:94 stop:270 length:177 start_codon:yes stop_codon:yes gene_type:complete
MKKIGDVVEFTGPKKKSTGLYGKIIGFHDELLRVKTPTNRIYIWREEWTVKAGYTNSK